MDEEKTDPASPDADNALTSALEATLQNLNESIQRMETIIGQLETGDADWDRSVELISEANELAMSSSQELDRVVQDVVYGAGDRSDQQDDGEDRQETLDLP
ncbi:MAG: exodeoxyribonuclease VII small subunit [Thermoleophilia bacterium]